MIDALATLREGLGLYPNATELHHGRRRVRAGRPGRIRVPARRSFEEACSSSIRITKTRSPDSARRCREIRPDLRRGLQVVPPWILELGYQDDIESHASKVGRALPS